MQSKKEHNNKDKLCNFSVVPGTGQALLGMPDINTLDIIAINCNTIDALEADRAVICNSQPTARVQDVSNTSQT